MRAASYQRTRTPATRAEFVRRGADAFAAVPAPARYDSPHVQLRRLAEAALVEGLDFESFWERALRVGKPLVTRHRTCPPGDCVIWPRDTFDRQNARLAILETREAWRSAYEGLPPRREELALQALGPALDGFGALMDVRSPDGHHCIAA